MKNLIALTDRADVHDHVQALWKTDLFRDSHAQGGFVHGIVDQFAYLPRLFADMSNPYLERSHFSTWWGVMMNRDDYANPFVHDLYWLHEFFHAGNMPYLPGIGKAAFNEKMQRNELEASVLSEIQVYFEMPELRASSFPHTIYADRFLSEHYMQELFKTNREVAIETIRTIRRDVMTSKPEHTMDITELWIRRFAEQNDVFAISWSDRYPEIEKQMRLLQFQSSLNRKGAMRGYRRWIEEEAAKDPVDNIPFRTEAELFAPHYWANKARFDSAMAKETPAKAA